MDAKKQNVKYQSNFLGINHRKHFVTCLKRHVVYPRNIKNIIYKT